MLNRKINQQKLLINSSKQICDRKAVETNNKSYSDHFLLSGWWPNPVGGFMTTHTKLLQWSDFPHWTVLFRRLFLMGLLSTRFIHKTMWLVWLRSCTLRFLLSPSNPSSFNCHCHPLRHNHSIHTNFFSGSQAGLHTLHSTHRNWLKPQYEKKCRR